ncbi:MAG: hypothetical protein NZM09_08465 [Ignavibacterium sp.]|nr:hypothetical protein [Ignavibacterium sp.]MDW8375716.1 hypothetical protein [Ignavibacteriales bacterium]
MGYSSFSSSSPSIDGFSFNIYVQTDQPLFEEVYPRLAIGLMREINSILPSDKTPYYPQLFSLSFNGVTAQYFDSRVYLEESVGLLFMNDKTFSDRNLWNYGVSLSFLAGLDRRNFNLQGWQTGIGAEYGLTFNGFLPSYLNVYLQFQYNF